MDAPDIVFGRNVVAEALKGDRAINRILVSSGSREGSIREIVALAKERGVATDVVPRARLDSILPGARHQGVIAYVSPVAYTTLDEVLKNLGTAKEPPFLVLLDGIEDPRNLGAILRTADATGAAAVLLPKRRSAQLTSTVAKTSAGATEHVPVARIGNIAQTIARLKDAGFWVVGADMNGTRDYFDADFSAALAIVIGGEGSGLSRLSRQGCDFLVKIPMRGKINSLNASVAASILMYEVLRQRRLP